MRRTAVALLVLGLVAFAPAVTASQDLVGVKYEHLGFVGVLHIADGHGLPFVAHNSLGQVVSGGVVVGPYFLLPVLNSGYHRDGWILRVRVGDKLFFIDDPEWEYL